MPVRFTTLKSIGRKGMGESIDGTGLSMCRWSTAKAITLRIGLIPVTSSNEGITKKKIWRSTPKSDASKLEYHERMFLPLRTSAFEMLGVNTISSTAFPVGSICLDTRVYVSGCVLSERREGERACNVLNAPGGVHSPAAQRVKPRHWNNQHKSPSLRRHQSGNRMGPRTTVLNRSEPKWYIP